MFLFLIVYITDPALNWSHKIVIKNLCHSKQQNMSLLVTGFAYSLYVQIVSIFFQRPSFTYHYLKWNCNYH